MKIIKAIAAAAVPRLLSPANSARKDIASNGTNL